MNDSKFIKSMAIQIMVIYKETKSDGFEDAIKNWDVDLWLLFVDDNFVPDEFKHLPNYMESREIMSSPLYKTLKEE